MSGVCFSVFLVGFAAYLGIKRSSGLHLGQQVSQRIKLFVKAGLLCHCSLAKENKSQKVCTLLNTELKKLKNPMKVKTVK